MTKKIMLSIPGVVVPDATERFGNRDGGLIKTRTARAYRIESTRGPTQEVLETVEPDEIVELELEDGVKLWCRADMLEERFATVAKRSAARAEGVVVIPARLDVGSASRGFFGGLVIKGLRLLGIDVADITVGELATRFDKKLEPGLWRCTNPQHDGGPPELHKPGDLKTDAEYLLFIHGTFSSTTAAFHDIWSPPGKEQDERLPKLVWDPNSILAFDHPTLSVSPIENAIELLTHLPRGAQLSLVTHSRGGLIGELLTRANRLDGVPFDSDDLRIFELAAESSDYEDAYKQQRKQLVELGKLLVERKPVVKRFVRVACPARGTTLASRRLDLYLSVIFNLLDRVPHLGNNPVVDLVGEFAQAVAKKRTDPRLLPGLEAQMPESPLIAMLNRSKAVVRSPLDIVSGDCEGKGIWKSLAVFVTDLFYREDHDLVVNTESMRGGSPRSFATRECFDHGADVAHSNYFKNPETRRYIFNTLAAEPNAVATEVPTRRATRGFSAWKPGRPAVVVIPGIMGSHLTAGSDRVWLDPFSIAAGGFEKLTVTEHGESAREVAPEGVIEKAYGEFCEFLERTHNVETFPYDWRLSIRDAGAKLASTVRRALKKAKADHQPVRIVSHSMGGLVVRAMVANDPGLWNEFCQHAGSRWLMLGTPNSGSFTIAALLTGRDKLVRKLALLDITRRLPGLLEIIASYPGVLEMLPAKIGDDSAFSPTVWNKLQKGDKDGANWSVPSESALRNASAIRTRLDDDLNQTLGNSKDRVLYVAGHAPETPSGVRIADNKIQIIGSPSGDGRVLWSDGNIPGTKVWYADVEHGRLAAEHSLFDAYLELIQAGSTQRLPTTPPALARGVEKEFVIETPERVDEFPDLDDLEREAMGARRRHTRKQATSKVTVSVSHGNLVYSKFPIMVGHYAGDGIYSAEKALDRILDNALSVRLRLDAYPDAVGTAASIAHPTNPSVAGIVVGLGEVGTLTPAGLVKAITRGMMAHVLSVTQTARANPGTTAPSANISIMLLGTGAGVLTIEQSVGAIVRSVLETKSRIVDNELDPLIRLDRVEILELYGDRAVQAQLALRRSLSDPEVAAVLAVEPEVHDGKGGRFRAYFEEDRGWWRRLLIDLRPSGALRYRALTELARAGDRMLRTDVTQLQIMVEKARDTVHDSPELGAALYEQLIPEDLKETLADDNSLALVLDPGAAAIPWELIWRRSPGHEPDRQTTESSQYPLAVRSGLVRQLSLRTSHREPRFIRTKNAFVFCITPDEFPPLAQAKAETKSVEQLLRDEGFKIFPEPDIPAHDLITKLSSRDYRIVHLAGHGVFEYPYPPTSPDCTCGQDHRTVTGMVLGDGLFLMSCHIRQLPSVPEFVFINCCSLGRTDVSGDWSQLKRDRPKLAANLAVEFIKRGCKAVIAAGWEVVDQPARRFAESFYQSFLSGRSFGESVKEARKQAFLSSNESNTWGAYQCYGDPDYTFTKATGQKSSRKPRYQASLQAFRIEIENVAQDAETVPPEDRSGLVRYLRDLELVGAQWNQYGRVLSALGKAYFELGEFRESITRYRLALQADDAEVTLKVAEQLANVEARYALDLKRDQSLCDVSSGLTPEMLLSSSEARIKMLLSMQPTAERHALLGSTLKRRAMITENQAARTALRLRCFESYDIALEIARKPQSARSIAAERTTAYYLLSCAAIGLAIPVKQRPKYFDASSLLDEVIKLCGANPDSRTEFWAQSMPIEARLLHAVIAKDLHNKCDGVLKEYTDLLRARGSHREVRSILDQLEFLAQSLPGADGKLVGRLLKNLAKE